MNIFVCERDVFLAFFSLSLSLSHFIEALFFLFVFSLPFPPFIIVVVFFIVLRQGERKRETAWFHCFNVFVRAQVQRCRTISNCYFFFRLCSFLFFVLSLLLDHWSRLGDGGGGA